jgi:hypothetical protein
VKIIFPVILFSLLLTSGCYTRFANVENGSPTPEQAEKAPDTLNPTDDETCVWERDLMGFPYLHCYKGYYPADWYRNNFSPWWYHGGTHRYSGSRCPDYYYYDNTCGCCRYYLNNPDMERSSLERGRSRKSPVSGPPDTTTRVSISSSSHSVVKIPLRQPNNVSTPSSKYQVVSDTSARKNSASADTSDTTKAKVTVDSVKIDSVNQANKTPVEQKPAPAPLPPKPRRPSRGR